jgi:hypothetical protein
VLEQRCQDVGSAVSFVCTGWTERSGFDGRFLGCLFCTVKVARFILGRLMKNFEEMRRQGDIDEKEFRNIQSLVKKDSKSSS